MRFICGICQEGLEDVPKGVPIPMQNGNADLEASPNTIAPGTGKIVGIALCGHIFHEVCLDRTLKDKGTVVHCPTCSHERQESHVDVVVKSEIIKLHPTKQAKSAGSSLSLLEQELKDVSKLSEMLVRRTATLTDKLSTETTKRENVELELASKKTELQEVQNQNEINKQKLVENYQNQIKEIQESHAAQLAEIKAKHQLELTTKVEELEKSLNIQYKLQENKISVANRLKTLAKELEFSEEDELDMSLLHSEIDRGLDSSLNIFEISSNLPDEIMETDEDTTRNELLKRGQYRKRMAEQPPELRATTVIPQPQKLRFVRDKTKRVRKPKNFPGFVMQGPCSSLNSEAFYEHSPPMPALEPELQDN